MAINKVNGVTVDDDSIILGVSGLSKVIGQTLEAAGGGGAFDATAWGTVTAEYRARDAVGSPVAALADNSGNGNNLAQGTSGMRPTLVTNALGAWSAIDFDGTDDQLDCATLGNCGTILALIGDITHTAANALCRAGGFRLLTFSPNSTTIYGGDGNEFWGSSVPTRVNGVSTSVFPGGGAFAVVAQSGTPTALGASFNIGNSVLNDAFNGKLIHVVLYTTALSTANQDGAAASMMSEYGL